MAIQRIMLIFLALNLLATVGSTYLNFNMFNVLVASTQNLGTGGSEANVQPVDAEEFTFFPVEKVIVSLQGQEREHYFVIDLVLQADKNTDTKHLEKIDPMVRNSVVANLSKLSFTELRSLSIADLQERLEKNLFDDFSNKNLLAPFAHVLVSKMVVQ